MSTCNPTTVGGVWLSHSSHIPSLSTSALQPVYAAENVVGVPIVGVVADTMLDLTAGVVPYVISTVFCGGVVVPGVVVTCNFGTVGSALLVASAVNSIAYGVVKM